MRIREGILDDLPEVLAMTVALTGMLPDAVEWLADFYLGGGEPDMPLYWRVVEENGRLQASLAGVVVYGDAVVVDQVTYQGQIWAPVLLWREFERWAAVQGARAIISSAPATSFGGRYAPVRRFLAAAGLEVTGPVEVRDDSVFVEGSAPSEVWMRKELH